MCTAAALGGRQCGGIRLRHVPAVVAVALPKSSLPSFVYASRYERKIRYGLYAISTKRRSNAHTLHTHGERRRFDTLVQRGVSLHRCRLLPFAPSDGQRRSCKGTVGLVRNGGAPAGPKFKSFCLQTLEMRRSDGPTIFASSRSRFEPSIFLIFSLRVALGWWPGGGCVSSPWCIAYRSRIASTVRNQKDASSPDRPIRPDYGQKGAGVGIIIPHRFGFCPIPLTTGGFGGGGTGKQ